MKIDNEKRAAHKRAHVRGRANFRAEAAWQARAHPRCGTVTGKPPETGNPPDRESTAENTSRTCPFLVAPLLISTTSPSCSRSSSCAWARTTTTAIAAASEFNGPSPRGLPASPVCVGVRACARVRAHVCVYTNTHTRSNTHRTVGIPPPEVPSSPEGFLAPPSLRYAIESRPLVGLFYVPIVGLFYVPIVGLFYVPLVGLFYVPMLRE